jgi:hypothetical protein
MARNKTALKEITAQINEDNQKIVDELTDVNHQLISVDVETGLVNDELIKIRKGIGQAFGKLIGGFKQLNENIIGNDLQKAEDAREQKEVLEKIADKDPKVEINIDTDKMSGKVGVGISAALSIIPGLAVGFVKGLADSLKSLGKLLKLGFKPLRKLLKLDKLFGPMIMKIKGFFTSIGKRFMDIGKSLKDLFKGVGVKIKNAFAPLTKGIDKILKPLKGIFAPILKSFKSIGSSFKSISDLFGGKGGVKLAKIIDPIKNTVNSVMKTAPRFFKLASGIGRLVGRIFLPFTIIMSLFDAFKGATTEAEKQEGGINKFIAGFGGAISGILKGLIGMPLDLLKGGVAWILGKFGFKDAEAFLNSFSFSDLIGDIVMTPINYLIGIVDNIKQIFQGEGSFIGNLTQAIGEIVSSLVTYPIKLLQDGVVKIGEFFGFDMSAVSDFDLAGKIKSLIMLPFNMIAGAFDFITNMFSEEGRAENMAKLSSIGNKIKDFLRGVIKSILPRPDDSKPWYSPANIAAKAIPAKVYEFAGIDKSTGQDIPEEPEVESTEAQAVPQEVIKPKRLRDRDDFGISDEEFNEGYVPVDDKGFAVVPQEQFTPEVPVQAITQTPEVPVQAITQTPISSEQKSEDAFNAQFDEENNKRRLEIADLEREKIKRLKESMVEAEASGDIERQDKIAKKIAMSERIVDFNMEKAGVEMNRVQNTQGAKMEAIQTDTENAKASQASKPVIVASEGAQNISQGGTTVNQVTYNSANHVDDTTSLMFAH